MRPHDIVGYMYKADIYCPKHVGREVAREINKADKAAIPQQDWEATERYLDRVQGLLGIEDRYDEHSFHSDDFPKVVLADHVQEYSVACCVCGEELLER